MGIYILYCLKQFNMFRVMERYKNCCKNQGNGNDDREVNKSNSYIYMARSNWPNTYWERKHSMYRYQTLIQPSKTLLKVTVGYKIDGSSSVQGNEPNTNWIRLQPRNSIPQNIQSSAIIMQCSIVWHCTNTCRNWGRVSIRWLTHKRHPIPRPNSQAMGCLFWIFVRNWPRFNSTACISQDSYEKEANWNKILGSLHACR